MDMQQTTPLPAWGRVVTTRPLEVGGGIIPAGTEGWIQNHDMRASPHAPIAAVHMTPLFPFLSHAKNAVFVFRDGEGGEGSEAFARPGDFMDPLALPLALIPCTEERYHEMLEVLFPALWEGPGFLVGEPWSHKQNGAPAYAPFFKIDGQHYEGNVPLSKREFRALTPALLAEAIARGAVA